MPTIQLCFGDLESLQWWQWRKAEKHFLNLDNMKLQFNGTLHKEQEELKTFIHIYSISISNFKILWQWCNFNLRIIAYKSEKRLNIKRAKMYNYFNFYKNIEEKSLKIKIILEIFQNNGHKYDEFKRNIASNLLSILLTLGRKKYNTVYFYNLSKKIECHFWHLI